jgi:hypothetical protein
VPYIWTEKSSEPTGFMLLFSSDCSTSNDLFDKIAKHRIQDKNVLKKKMIM